MNVKELALRAMRSALSAVCLAVLAWTSYITPLAAAELQIDAVAGEPFGVARIVLPVRAGEVDRNRFSIHAEGNRTHYPAFDTYSPGLILSSLLGNKPPAPQAVIAVFLFEGDQPLTVTVQTPTPQKITIHPGRGKLAHRRLLKKWWRAYTTAAAVRVEADEYPPLIENYLTGMLANRLDLPPVRLSADEQPSPPQQTLELLTGAESLQASAIRQMMQQRRKPQPASLPMPEPARWLEPAPAAAAIDAGEAPQIEPLASRVPPDCFYVRFGSFKNYLWVTELMEEFAADTAQLASLRGVDEKLMDRLKRQLALRESDLAKLFGDSVVEDIALIGRDLYLRHGAAVGMLFKTKDEAVFAADLRGQRNFHLKQSKAAGAKETLEEIAGRKVSLVSTPDGGIRSFVAVDGKYYLVTTSRKMVEGFFAAVDGKGSLAGLPSLKQARRKMPLVRNDAVFAHFSREFLEALVSPHYQVELNRRHQAAAGIEMVRLARLAAASEGRPADSIATLIGSGFLPPWFNTRAGDCTFVEDEATGEASAGRVYCSARGYRGAFTPIPDMPITEVTPDELMEVSIRTGYYTRHWRLLDPVTFAIRRTRTLKKDNERIETIVFDGNVALFDEKKYGWLLSMLGPPTTEVMAKAPGDVVNVQASLKAGALQPGSAPHLMYAGLQDTEPRTKTPPVNIFDWYRFLKYSPGYLGAWPKPGLLDALPVGLLGVRHDDGFTRYLLGLWRWEGRGHSVLSFDQPTLAAAAPHLKLQPPAAKPAHIRFTADDLSKTKLAGWINNIYYNRAAQTSRTNVQLMHTLHQQFKVPPADAPKHASAIFGGEIICALGGKYELREDPAPHWVSTAWEKKPAEVATAGSPLRWLREVQATIIKEGDQLNTHAEINIRRAPKKKAPNALDLLNIFGK